MGGIGQLCLFGNGGFCLEVVVGVVGMAVDALSCVETFVFSI